MTNVDTKMGDNTMSATARDVGDRATVTVCARCYREHEKARILAALLANSSLLVVSGPGMRKSTLARFVAEELRGRGFHIAVVAPRTGKQFLVETKAAVLASAAVNFRALPNCCANADPAARPGTTSFDRPEE